MTKRTRRVFDCEFKIEAVRLVTDKGYTMVEASQSLGVDYSVLRRWKQQVEAIPQDISMAKRMRFRTLKIHE